jgi:alpha-L-rhamnosidase
MQAWVELVAPLAVPSRLWDTGFQYGDWLDPTAPADRPEETPEPGGSVTPRDDVATVAI